MEREIPNISQGGPDNQPNFTEGKQPPPSAKVERITVQDLRPLIPEPDGSVLVLQRHAKDNRDPNSELEIGALVPESAERVHLQAKEFFEQVFNSLTPEERKTIDIMVIASDTKLVTPEGLRSPHQRAIESAEQVLAGIREAMQEHGIEENQLLNNAASTDGKPIEQAPLRDLLATEDSPEYLNFLKEKYGTGVEFWQAYENDTERETREQMGAEGPTEIADRLDYFLSRTTESMNACHRSNPGRRLITWVVTHYDTISPYLKRHVTKMDQTMYLPVDHESGIVINIDREGQAKTAISGQEYEIDLSVKE